MLLRLRQRAQGPPALSLASLPLLPQPPHLRPPSR
jgi:hypothetical protein